MSAVAVQEKVGIRDMQFEDLPDIAAIEHRAYVFPWCEDIFSVCLSTGYDCLVLEADDRIIGYSIMSFRGKVCHLLNLCIDTAFQCRGYGGLLLDSLLERARHFGANRMVLEVRPSNAVALKMYMKRGFEEAGIHPGYYPSFGKREDALMMRRMIDASVADTILSA